VAPAVLTCRVVGTILRSRHWTICGQAENGRTGVEKFQKLKPDVVLLDLSMPDMTGIEAAQQMSAVKELETQPERQEFVQ
jgi:YesN/AraC family two-component response regulator